MAKNALNGEEGARLNEFLKKNMPTLQKISPEDYAQFVNACEILAEKYNQKANQMLHDEGMLGDTEAGVGVGVAVATAVGTAVGTAAGSIVGKKASG